MAKRAILPFHSCFELSEAIVFSVRLRRFPRDAALFVRVAGLLGKRSSKPIAAFLIFAVLLAMLNQSRWQPWFYQILVHVGLRWGWR